MTPSDVDSPPVVTVVISCYNHADYVESAIHSILRQTYPHIELLVYDDGSQDSSAAILAPLADQYGFSFTPQKNKGLSATLNDALQRATGKYFFQMGSDDIAFLDKLEKQVAIMEAEPDITVCGGNAVFIDSHGQLLNKRQRFHPARDLTFDDMFENRKPGFMASTALIRSEPLRKVGGYRDDIPLEDLYMWLKLAYEGYRIYVTNDLLLYYRKHDSNTYKNIAYMRDSIRKTLEEYRDHPSYERVINKNLNSFFLTAAKQGRRSLAWELFRELSPKHYSRHTLRGLIKLLTP